MVLHNSTSILPRALWTALLAVHQAAQCCKSMGMDDIKGTCRHVHWQLPVIDGLPFWWGMPPCLAEG